MFVLGERFSGKTFFISGCPRTLILDYEAGAWGVPDNINRAYRMEISTPEQEVAVFAQLEADKDNPARPFDRIVIETIDQMVEVDAEYLGIIQSTHSKTWDGTDIRQWGQKGAGYSILTAHIYDRLRKLGAWGYAWTVCGHVKEETIHLPDGKELTGLRPVCYSSLAAVVGRLADVRAMVNLVKIAKPVYKEVKIVGSTQIRKVSAGSEDTLRVQLDCAAQEGGLSASGGKLRGVANLRMKILLPELSSGEIGWDAFTSEYTKAAETVQHGVSL